MKKKKQFTLFHLHPFLTYLTVCSFLSPTFAHAADKKDAATPPAPVETFTCRTEIYYSWKVLPAPAPSNPNDAKGASPTSQPDATPREVFWNQHEETAASEDEAKAKIGNLIASLKAKAEQECRDEHQNQASCVTHALEKSQSSYQTLDFSSRRAILDAITADCKANAGTCLAARSTDTVCMKNTVAAPDTGGTTTDTKKKK